jgi:hypothetical protein
LSARPKGRHANEAAGNIENGASFFFAGKAKIELDALINQATVPAVPFGPEDIDNSKARACAASSVRSNRDSDGARSDVACFKRKRRSRRRKTQDRDVGSRIATGDLGSDDRTACRQDFKFVAPGQRLLRGDDDIGPPHDTGKPAPACQGYRRNDRSCGVNPRGQGV